MSNTNIFVEKATFDATSQVLTSIGLNVSVATELSVNGATYETGVEPGVSALYAWYDEDNERYVYTLSETPVADDKLFVITDNYFGESTYVVQSLADDVLTYGSGSGGGGVFYTADAARTSAKDIEF